MTEKENALRIIRFNQPERVVARPPSYTLHYLGSSHEGFTGGGHHLPVGSKWTDIWRTEWHKEHADVMGFPKGCPLDEPGKLASYNWPDPNDERICGPIYKQAEAFDGGDCFLAGSHRDTLWEKSYMLVGMENMMEYFYDKPEFVREILHRIMDFQLGIARHYLKAGIELAGLGDDLGTQQSLLLSPGIIEEFLIPEYRRIFDFYRQQGILIEFHSCGHIEPLLETFIDLGVDILNPVQATANNLGKVRQATQGRMALAGAISTATIMAGPPDRIRSEVWETIQLLGSEGGYFCRPDQGMPFPAENLQAYEKALADYGTY